jgi:hypothetical protein
MCPALLATDSRNKRIRAGTPTPATANHCRENSGVIAQRGLHERVQAA